MKLKHIFTVAASAAMLFSTTACENFLSREPLDTRVETNFFTSEAEAMEALIATYDVLQWNTLPGLQGGFHPMNMISDIASDDAYAGGGDRSDGAKMLQFDQHQILPTLPEAYGLWAKPYRGIYRANYFLENIDNINADDDFVTRTKAEAKFLRAYFYYEIGRAFANAPLILETLSAKEYEQPQATPQEIYNQIAKDLIEAIPALPEQSSAADAGRVTKWAAQGLLARVYLHYNGVYGSNLKAGEITVDATKALEGLEDVINNSGHDLMADYSEIFTKDNEFNIESVFEVAYSEKKLGDWGCVECGDGNIAAQMMGPRLNEPGLTKYYSGWSFSIPTQDLVNAFESGDPRLDATIIYGADLEGGVTTGFQHTGYYSKKYAPTNDYPELGDAALSRGNNYRVIRFADILLMAAELHLTAGDAGKAQTYLDRVRGRVGMPAVPATLDNIYQERRVELAMEGHRYWDLVRRGTAKAIAEMSIPAAKEATFVGDAGDFEINPAKISQTKGLFPIPQSEMDLASGTWKQNDGY